LVKCRASWAFVFAVIELLPSNYPIHDAKTPDGKLVQIRTTQGKSVPLKVPHENLLVLRLHPNATIEEVFNGPGDIAWELTKSRTKDKNGQFNISLGVYREASKSVPESQRIKKRAAR